MNFKRHYWVWNPFMMKKMRRIVIINYYVKQNIVWENLWTVKSPLPFITNIKLQRKNIANVQQLIVFMIIKIFEKKLVPWNGIHIGKSHTSNEYVTESNHLWSIATFLACDRVHYSISYHVVIVPKFCIFIVKLQRMSISYIGNTHSRATFE